MLMEKYKEKQAKWTDDRIIQRCAEKLEGRLCGKSFGYIVGLRYLNRLCNDYPRLLLAGSNRIGWLRKNVKRIRTEINSSPSEKLFWKTFGKDSQTMAARESFSLSFGTPNTELHKLFVDKAPEEEEIEPSELVRGESVTKLIEEEYQQEFGEYTVSTVKIEDEEDGEELTEEQAAMYD